MKHRLRSLAGRLTLAFVVSQALGVAVFLLAIYPIMTDGSEAIGPALVANTLEVDINLDATGRVSLPNDATVREIATRNPGLWFVVIAGPQVLRFGPVPVASTGLTTAHGDMREGRFRGIGADGQAGEAIVYSFKGDSGPVTVVAGGMTSSDLGFGDYLRYMFVTGLVALPIFSAILTFVGLLAAIPIVVRAMRPTARAASLLDPANLSARLPEGGVVKELLPIVQAFNAALDRLAVTFEQRRRFIADVAHELRTPLAVLSMQVETLPTDSSRPDLQRTVYRLSQMIGQMLDAERLALAGRRRDLVDLVELARNAAADVAPLAVSHGYEVAVLAPSHPVPVQGDGYALSRTVANLLGNAVAHGGGHGTISVRVEASGAVEVADEGPGIPPEMRERIFEPFYRGRWDKDGCGLGLHLVREIMTAHGGAASVLTSESGAIFRLSFPRVTASIPGTRIGPPVTAETQES